MEKNMFSVIVPVYNVEKFLPNCIDSILAQIFPKYEIILVDDGSTDGSGLICDEYALKSDKITVIHQQNKGLSGARNTGINKARGEYICFVDSDDYIEKELLSKTFYYLNQGYDMVSFCARRVDEEKNFLYEMRYDPQAIRSFNLDEYGLKKFVYGILLQYKIGWEAWVSVYRKDILEKNDLKFDERIKFAEDKVFVMDYIGYARRILKIPDIVYDYTDRSNSLTREKTTAEIIEYIHRSVEDIIHTKSVRNDNRCLIYIGVTYYYYKNYSGYEEFQNLIIYLRAFKQEILDYMENLTEIVTELEMLYGKNEGKEIISFYKKICEGIK